jgi:crossover junction endodeoxyribonuclease RusA
MTDFIRLPWPVSANRYWRSFVPRGKSRAIVVLSDEAKSYKAQVGWMIAKQAGMRSPHQGRVHLLCRLYPSLPKDAAQRMRKLGEGWDDTVRSLDLDNALKVTIDALKGIAYQDDAQVWRISAERMEPDGEARIEVCVLPIALTVPQTSFLPVEEIRP